MDDGPEVLQLNSKVYITLYVYNDVFIESPGLISIKILPSEMHLIIDIVYI